MLLSMRSRFARKQGSGKTLKLASNHDRPPVYRAENALGENSSRAFLYTFHELREVLPFVTVHSRALQPVCITTHLRAVGSLSD